MSTLIEALNSAYEGTNSSADSRYRLNKKNCSAFLRDLGTRLGVHIGGGNADQQVDYMKKHWIELTKGDGRNAARVAQAGFIVVAGITSQELNALYPPERHTHSGHVAVVVPTESLEQGIYPHVWGGSMGNAQSKGQNTVNYVFGRKPIAENVHYFRGPCVFLREGDSYKTWNVILGAKH